MRLSGFHPIAFFRSPTGRLMMSYLAIIVVLSVGFSVIFYYTSVARLTVNNVMLPDDSNAEVPDIKLRSYNGAISKLSKGQTPELEEVINQHISSIQAGLRQDLIVLNIGVFAFGSMMSFHRARRTLRPIEQAIEDQSRFASDASHELRTPLAVMQMENEEGLSISKLPAQARRLIESNLEEIGKLRSLSDGLLQLARNEAPTLGPVWIDDIGNEAINRIVKTAQEKQVSIEDQWPHLQVRGDEQSLTQIVLILLDNAIKYSDPQTTIYLESSKTAKYVQLHVRDEGRGIAAESLPHLFERFYQADKGAGGHGLGLSIARKLIEQQHAKISVTSTPGRGSTFTITMPFISE